MSRGRSFVVLDMVETAHVVSALANEFRTFEPHLARLSADPELARVHKDIAMLHNRLRKRLKTAGVTLGDEL